MKPCVSSDDCGWADILWVRQRLISGYKDVGEVSDYGLRDAGVDIDKQKVITIADKDARIVGIYPRTCESEILPYFTQTPQSCVR